MDRASGPAEGLGPPTSAPEVAEAYFLSIIDGDFSAAAEWVRRDQQGIVEALALGRGPGTQPTMSGSVSIAGLNSTGQTADGETASVTFVGKMCRTPAPSQAQPSPDPQCVENDDPQTDLPYFIVNLVHTARDGWRVTFGGPDGQE